MEIDGWTPEEVMAVPPSHVRAFCPAGFAQHLARLPPLDPSRVGAGNILPHQPLPHHPLQTPVQPRATTPPLSQDTESNEPSDDEPVPMLSGGLPLHPEDLTASMEEEGLGREDDGCSRMESGDGMECVRPSQDPWDDLGALVDSGHSSDHSDSSHDGSSLDHLITSMSTSGSLSLGSHRGDGGSTAAPLVAWPATPPASRSATGGSTHADERADDGLQVAITHTHTDSAQGHARVHTLPDELLQAIFRLLDAPTLLCSVPAVCRRWRDCCGGTPAVKLDLTFLSRRSRIIRSCGEPEGVDMFRTVAERWRRASELNLELILKVTDAAVMAVVERLPQLTKVNLSGCRYVGHPSFVALAKRCPLLTEVNFGCCAATDASIVALAQHCPQLSKVELWGSNRLTSVAVDALAGHCRRLSSLTIGPSCSVTDHSVIALAERCPSLAHVKFSLCNQLTDASVVALTRHCRELATVSFESCEGVTDGCTEALQEHPQRRLVSINLQECERVTDACVMAFAGACPNLERVDVSLCFRLTDASVVALAERCPKLRAVDFSKCPRVTDAGVPALLKCPRLRLVSGVPNWPL